MARVTATNETRPQTAYAGSGSSWATDAVIAYGPMARHLVHHSPITLEGALVLDAGAGTGAAGAVLAERGALVVAADLEMDMLRHDRSSLSAVVADVNALPFRVESFDACVAAFVLNHLDAPAVALQQMGMATRAGGVVLASVFSASKDSSKRAVDDVLAKHGWRKTPWYAEIQRRSEVVGTTERMATVARAAGFERFEIVDEQVDLDLDPSDVVRYRFSVPHIARFVDEIDGHERVALVAEAEAAVADLDESFAPGVIELVATIC